MINVKWIKTGVFVMIFMEIVLVLVISVINVYVYCKKMILNVEAFIENKKTIMRHLDVYV